MAKCAGKGRWVVTALAFLGPGVARYADAAPPPVAGEERLVEGPFWVDAVNRSERNVIVRGADGTQMTVDVLPNAIGFDDVKSGDRVDLELRGSAVIGLRSSRGTSAESMEAPANPAAAPYRTPSAKGENRGD